MPFRAITYENISNLHATASDPVGPLTRPRRMGVSGLSLRFTLAKAQDERVVQPIVERSVEEALHEYGAAQENLLDREDIPADPS